MKPDDLEGKTVEDIRVSHDRVYISFTDGTQFTIEAHSYNYSEDGDAEAGLDWNIF